MKKILFAIALGVLMITCQERESFESNQITRPPASAAQKLTAVDTRKIRIEDGVLTFESIEFYESIVDFEDYSKVAFTIKHIENMKFNSYRKLNPSSNIFGDAFIESILNKDQMVRIGEWLIHFDVANQQIDAVNSSITKNNAIKQEHTTFSNTENVLEFLSNPKQLQARSKNGLCGESGVEDRDDKGWYTSVTGGPTSDINAAWLRHKKFGIYFKLQTECTSPFIANQYFWLTYDKKQYKKTCDPEVYMGTGTVWSPLSGPGWTEVLSQGTKNFNKYWVRITNGGRCTLKPNGTLSYDDNLVLVPIEIRVNW
jgi:hypothetical protein